MVVTLLTVDDCRDPSKAWFSSVLRPQKLISCPNLWSKRQIVGQIMNLVSSFYNSKRHRMTFFVADSCLDRAGVAEPLGARYIRERGEKSKEPSSVVMFLKKSVAGASQLWSFSDVECHQTRKTSINCYIMQSPRDIGFYRVHPCTRPIRKDLVSWLPRNCSWL